MTTKEIKEMLMGWWDILDDIQEQDFVQDDDNLMFDIGEVMGAICNVCDDIDESGE